MSKDCTAIIDVGYSTFDYHVRSVAYNVLNQIIAKSEDLLYTYNIGCRMMLGWYNG